MGNGFSRAIQDKGAMSNGVNPISLKDQPYSRLSASVILFSTCTDCFHLIAKDAALFLPYLKPWRTIRKKY
jgi:hypothetical protein